MILADKKRYVIYAIAMSSLFWQSGCATWPITYDELDVGRLEGKVLVQWIEPDLFIFTPDQNERLKFIRKNGDEIMPQRMLTDGGSIPRSVWILRSYSPWGFAPAFIIHDWLFEVKHCHFSEHEGYTHVDAARVMAEIMKTMMESKKVAVDRSTVISMYSAVVSPLAKENWDNGKCIPATNELFTVKPIREFELTFP